MMGMLPLSPMMALLALAVGYFFGSIPFGLIFTRAAGLGDVRSIGSGNIGATNVLRTGNRKIAALTLLCDGLKGTIPVVIMSLYANQTAGIFAGLGAIAGHILPVWLGFRGGKGVATCLGVLFGLSWQLGLIFLAVWLLMAFAFRRSSLAALTAIAVMPFAAWGLGQTSLVIPCIIFAVIIWWTHRENIGRLLTGKEPKIELGKKP